MNIQNKKNVNKLLWFRELMFREIPVRHTQQSHRTRVIFDIHVSLDSTSGFREILMNTRLKGKISNMEDKIGQLLGKISRVVI